MPFMFNATIVNGMGLGGWLAEPPRFEPTVTNGDENENDLGAHLDFRFDFSETLFPWSGFLAMYVRVKASGAAERGIASGRGGVHGGEPPRPRRVRHAVQPRRGSGAFFGGADAAAAREARALVAVPLGAVPARVHPARLARR